MKGIGIILATVKAQTVCPEIARDVSSVVVLLCRICVETVPALKDMDWELGQWHPLIQDRKFLPWLIKVSLT